MPDETDLILIPGLLCTPALYAPQVAALPRHVRVAVTNVFEDVKAHHEIERVIGKGERHPLDDLHRQIAVPPPAFVDQRRTHLYAPYAMAASAEEVKQRARA